MVFNTNQAFKLFIFVWGDYDGETFGKRNFASYTISLFWTFLFGLIWFVENFYLRKYQATKLLLQVVNFFRYGALAIIPPSHHGILKLWLCDYGAAVEGQTINSVQLIAY